MAIADVHDYKVVLPHGSNFQLIDRVTTIDAANRSVTAELDYFEGCRLWTWLADHFPGNAMFPGVLMIEIINQTAGQLAQVLPAFDGRLVYFIGTGESRFPKPIRPPAILVATASIIGDIRHNIGTATGIIRVDGIKAAEATIKFAIS